MVRTLAGQEEARVILLAVSVTPRNGEDEESRSRRADRAAAALSAELRASAAIAQAMPLTDTGPRDAIASALFSRRLELLLPGWLAERKRDYAASGSSAGFGPWLAERSAADLERYLSKPEALAAQDIITADPLLLVPGLAGRMEGMSGRRWLPWPGPAGICSCGHGSHFAA